MKPRRIRVEHGTGQDGEMLRRPLGYRPRVEYADPPDSITNEDGADWVPEVEPEGNVEPSCADVGAPRLENLCVPAELASHTTCQGVRDVLPVSEGTQIHYKNVPGNC